MATAESSVNAPMKHVGFSTRKKVKNHWFRGCQHDAILPLTTYNALAVWGWAWSVTSCVELVKQL